MAIATMEVVNIVGKLRQLDMVLFKCCENGNFHPQQLQSNQKFKALEETNPYAALSQEISDYCLENNISPYTLPITDYCVDLEQIKKDFTQERDKLAQIKQELLEAAEKKTQYQNTLKHINHIIGLKSTFDDIFSCKHVKVRFGRLPADSYQKLEFYEDKPFYFLTYDHDENYYWGVYFMPKGMGEEIDFIFSNLYFERIWVPDYAHGTPYQAKDDFEEKLRLLKIEIQQLEEKKRETVAKQQQIALWNEKLSILKNCFDLRKHVSVFHDTFYLEGFVPQNEKKAFCQSFETLPEIDVVVSDIDEETAPKTPVKLKNNRFVKPFEQFVSMYGTPAYNDIDPTPFVAITYTLLFGIMFGDLGQGLLVALLGIVLSKIKKMNFGRILTRIGLSSAFFGCVYGSCFGMEDLLTPIYTHLLHMPSKPIEILAPDSTNFILLASVALGGLTILITMVLNIYIGFKQKNMEKALFSANGITGLMVYGFIMTGAALLLLFNVNVFNPLFIVFFIVLPLVLMFFRQPLAKALQRKKGIKPESWFDFISQNFFEVFEYVLSYITNTMSFLRVGSFIISHAGMMAVVFSLSSMMNGAGSIIVIIIGNALVMGLEGLVVGIQVLRLNFYEMFSRFYEGNGKAFIPVKLSRHTKA